MGILAKIRVPILPFSDLNADGQITNQLQMPGDVQPTMAVLAAQSATGPKLVQADTQGNLQGAPSLGVGSALSTPAVNTAAVVTLTPAGGQRIVVDYIVYSYNAAPTGGRVTIVDGATTVMDIDDAAAGQQSILQGSPGLRSLAIDNVVVITLAAAGAAVTGKLFVMFHTINV